MSFMSVAYKFQSITHRNEVSHFIECVVTPRCLPPTQSLPRTWLQNLERACLMLMLVRPSAHAKPGARVNPISPLEAGPLVEHVPDL